MSNVIIGIIGVILFIGLAVAGALFLGDRFKATRAQTEAATIGQQMQQLSSAYDLYRLKVGSAPPPATAQPAHLRAQAIMATMTPRFLKTRPTTDRPDSWWFFVDENGDPFAAAPNIVMFNISGVERNAVAVCDSIAKAAGMADAQGRAPSLTKPPTDRQQGCYQYYGSWGYAQGLSGNLHFFRRI